MNQVNLQGQITRIYRGTKYTIFTLFVFGPQRNFPNVSFPTSLIRRYEEEQGEFQTGDLVRVEASMVAFIKQAQRTEGTEETEEPHNVVYVEQIVKGHTIERVNLTENPQMHRYANKVSLSGTISRVFQEGNVVRLLIKPDDRRFNVLVIAYERYPVAFTETYQPGCAVEVTASIQTTVKEGSHGITHYENLVVRQIRKIETDDSDTVTE